ncbi:MAG: hypothetical protein A4S09_04120 [Proteobacteria bacterium SG_bin7]|nr:MAG: hypothetical protein A4S09_04120 [Proteobacteria bacterium SG_bin7]
MAKAKKSAAKAKKTVVKAKKPVKKLVKTAVKSKKVLKKAVKVAAPAVAKAKSKTPVALPPVKKEKEPKVKAVKPLDEAPVIEEKKPEEAEIVLTDAEGRRYCRVQDCDQVAIVEAYCRYHYLLYWKKIQYRKKILADNKFYKYIDELTAKYPDKFLDVIRKDLMSQKNFASAIQEMEIDESADETDVGDKSYMDDMRGIGTEVGAGDESSDDF